MNREDFELKLCISVKQITAKFCDRPYTESEYERILASVLSELGLDVKTQCSIVDFKIDDVEFKKRMDLIVNDTYVLEIKAVNTISAQHTGQLVYYMQKFGVKIGYVVNFVGADGWCELPAYTCEDISLQRGVPHLEKKWIRPTLEPKIIRVTIH